MSADIEFERRVRSELRSTLDRVDGPHADWATSPAAATVAADPARSSRSLPWRLLAVAAVLVVGSVAAVILASPEDRDDARVAGCPTLADYAAASAQPSPVLGQAPEVSFPPVAPTATMTTGLLQPGDWAVISNADGPGLQIRVRDVRACGRLPDLRSTNRGGSIYLATVDVRFVRDTGMGWLGVQSLLEGAVGGRQGPTHVSGGLRGIPGVDSRTSSDPWEGFAVSGTYILDVPRTDEQIAVDHPTPNTTNLPGLEVNDFDSPRARWVLREGALAGDRPSREPFAVPGATPTTGQVQPGEDVTFRASGDVGVLRLSDIDEVVAYPGLQPAPGNVFVEVLLTVRHLTGPLVAPRDLHALDEAGRELPILQDALNAERRVGVLPNLLNEAGNDEAWIVVEAPANGPIRLEYRHDANADQTFWIQLRG
jgi:hypothetical protein